MASKDKSNKLLVVIAGPTASGKTEIAIQLAKYYDTEIVGADSRQVFKELNIGVGKPSMDQLAAVQHHLIGHRSIIDHYSAGHYTTDALHIIYTLFARHDIVILSGGTGLYLKSIIEGFDAMPQVPVQVTEYWTKVWENQGTKPLIAALKELDPDYLTIVDQDNHSRLIRAVAVSDHSGRPFSSFRKGEKADHFFNVIPIVIDLPRKELYTRIDHRVLDMLQRGWMAEAKELFPHRHLHALQTVGYKELFEVIEGKMGLEQSIPLIQQSTRHYAKRQLTWWRNQGQWLWIHPDNIQDMKNIIEQERNHT